MNIDIETLQKRITALQEYRIPYLQSEDGLKACGSPEKQASNIKDCLAEVKSLESKIQEADDN